MSAADPRIDHLEAELARLKAAERARSGAAPPAVEAPPTSALSRTLAAGMERARQQRARAAAEQAERDRRQAERDAPKQAKRDTELRAYDEQIAALETQRAELEDQVNALRMERLRLAREPL